MSLHLILMRHGSAEPYAATDKVRSLTEAGRDEVKRVAEQIRSRGWRPDMVMASNALRTHETSHLAIEAMGNGLAVLVEPALYLASALSIVSELADMGDGVNMAMLVGHNPGFSSTVRWLSGREVLLGTAHAALLEHQAARWQDAVAQGGGWRLSEIVRPA